MARPIVSFDVESSGPVPGLGDLISFGAVFVEPGLERRHYSGIVSPKCEIYDPKTYELLGMTRYDHKRAVIHPTTAAINLIRWLRACEPNVDRFIMLSDNPGFDFAWINYTLAHSGVTEWKVFGHSARRIGDAYAGLKKDSRSTQGWKKLRQTAHTHHPVDDAVGNAEAWLEMWRKLG